MSSSCGGCCCRRPSEVIPGWPGMTLEGQLTSPCPRAFHAIMRPGCGFGRSYVGPAAGALSPTPFLNAATMKLTIERAALLKALGHVQSVVERRTTIPILSNVLLGTETAGRLSMSATDMD